MAIRDNVICRPSSITKNVFIQLDEPSFKRGVWIKTSGVCKNIIITNSLTPTSELPFLSNSIILYKASDSAGEHSTELYTDVNLYGDYGNIFNHSFDNIFYVQDESNGIDNTVERYFGDGIQWIKLTTT